MPAYISLFYTIDSRDSHRLKILVTNGLQFTVIYYQKFLDKTSPIFSPFMYKYYHHSNYIFLFDIHTLCLLNILFTRDNFLHSVLKYSRNE